MSTFCQRWIPVLIVGLLAAALGAALGPFHPAPPQAAFESPQTPRAAERRCAECHADITDAYRTAPHARTLVRATDEAADQFAGRSFHRDDSGIDVHYKLRDGRLFVSSPAYARDLPIDWMFGSGTHARTPLMTWTDDTGGTSAVEHGVSWYPGGTLGVTPGMEEIQDSAGIQALGHLRPSAEAINCFGCHCTFVPTDGGRILFDQIEPGVGCAVSLEHAAARPRNGSRPPRNHRAFLPADSSGSRRPLRRMPSSRGRNGRADRAGGSDHRPLRLRRTGAKRLFPPAERGHWR